MMKYRHSKKGFTIVELVIVIAVIGILASVLIPTFSGVISSAKESAALQEAKSGLDTVLVLTGGSMTEGSLFYVDNNDDGKSDYSFTYVKNKISASAKDDVPLYCGTETADTSDDYYVVYLSKDAFVDANPTAADAKLTADAANYLMSTSAPGTDYTTPKDLVKHDDHFSVALANGKTYHIYFSNDIKASVLIYIAPVGSYNPVDPVNPVTQIKNIIFLIPDGAGFGTYDIANAYKHKYASEAVNGVIPGIKSTEDHMQATPITTNAIAGMTVEGLYLDEFMIASADTLMFHGISDGATDSTTAGTALLGGYKTNYLMSGVDNEANARANLLELCRLEGKATGFVTTKCLIDATPCSGTVHLLRRPDQKESYQVDANKQYMVCGIDVLLAYGTDGGYYRNGVLLSNSLKARDFGYTLVDNLSTLTSVVNSGARKVFSNILNDCNGEYDYDNTDYQANHIKYDCFATNGTDLTLMDMAKGALQILSSNVNDPDGFCLVIEGGAIDNAAEGRNVKEAVSEYLAFDEVFAYCVNWAKQRGDTVVVACPDHDSGGFYTDPNNASAPYKCNAKCTYDTMDEVLTALHNGTVQNNTVLAGERGGHSTQNVPVWLYAPDSVRNTILNCLLIPTDTDKTKVRTGTFYDGTVINTSYDINNSDISPAIVRALGLMSFDEATAALFTQINVDTTTYGTYDAATETFTFKNGETVKRNANTWTKNGVSHTFRNGFSLYLTNVGDDYNIHHSPAMPAGTFPNRFYVPRSVLVDMGYITE